MGIGKDINIDALFSEVFVSPPLLFFKVVLLTLVEGFQLAGCMRSLQMWVKFSADKKLSI